MTFDGLGTVPIQVKIMSLYLCSWFGQYLCELIANRYAQQNNQPKWVDVSTDGIVILMGIHMLPQIKDYWSMDSLLGVLAVQRSIKCLLENFGNCGPTFT